MPELGESRFSNHAAANELSIISNILGKIKYNTGLSVDLAARGCKAHSAVVCSEPMLEGWENYVSIAKELRENLHFVDARLRLCDRMLC